MEETCCNGCCDEPSCMEYSLVNKFSLKVVFNNRQDNPLVIYKSDEFSMESNASLSNSQGSSRLYPLGTVIALNLSSRNPFTCQIEKEDGTLECILVPPHSEAALTVASIVKVSVYLDSGSIAGGKFYFDLIQPVEL